MINDRLSSARWIATRRLNMAKIRKGIAERLNTAMPAILIILVVGIIVGSWMFWHSASLYLLCVFID